MEWLDSPDPKDVVMWLDGGAGSEKSLICYTVTQICIEQRRLSGSFSLRRTNAKPARKHDATGLIATLIWQLLLHIPETRDHIAEKIAADMSILDRSLETQLDALLVQPLAAVAQSGLSPQDAQLGARLFVIDGLDECDDETQCLVVESFTAALERVPESVSHKLLFSSQSESHLVSTCRKPPTATRLRRLHLEDSPRLSSGALDIQLSPVESYMDLRSNLYILQCELTWRRAKADELEKCRLELDKREEEIRDREEDWEQKEAEWRRQVEWLREKESEILRKEDDEKHREEKRQGKETRIREDDAELSEETQRILQRMQRLKEEILNNKDELWEKEHKLNFDELLEILRKEHDTLMKEQEMRGERCNFCVQPLSSSIHTGRNTRPPRGDVRPTPRKPPPLRREHRSISREPQSPPTAREPLQTSTDLESLLLLPPPRDLHTRNPIPLSQLSKGSVFYNSACRALRDQPTIDNSTGERSTSTSKTQAGTNKRQVCRTRPSRPIAGSESSEDSSTSTSQDDFSWPLPYESPSLQAPSQTHPGSKRPTDWDQVPAT